MIARCENPNDPGYKNYGGRGILVCRDWHSFECFLRDMGPRPSLAHSLNRKDNDGPYSPDNCIWSTRREQGRNKRNNRLLSYRGRQLCLSEWAEELGIPLTTLWRRLRRGWSVKKTLSTPVDATKRNKRWQG